MAVSLSSPLIWAISIIVLLPSITILGGGVNDPYGMNNGYEPVVTGPLLTRETREYINFEDEPPTRIAGGQMEWAIPLLNAGGQPLSTPSLSDLDLDGTLEIVVASASDQVFALTPNGSYFWDTPYQDDVIDYLGQTSVTTGLDFEPPPFFTSVTSKDISIGNRTEIILGVKNGVLHLDSDGEKMHKLGFTNEQYFSTPCITDLEGSWNGNKDELEISLPVNDESGKGWLEVYESDACFLIRKEAISSSRSPIFANSIVASDLDGLPDRGLNASPPGPEDELDTELVACYPGVPLSIFARNGTDNGYPIYDQKIIVKDPVILVFGTPAVGNISGGPECEIIVPYCKGYGNWTNWTGGIKAYAYDGSPLWDFPLQDKGTGVCTSPAIAFMDQGKELPKKKVIMFGSDNGFVYAIDAETHSLMWQFDTGGRVLSSPAICNIDNDDELEMVIGSDFGMVYCFDLDPSDGMDEGVNYPGDGAGQDVLWVYDTSTPIGISSPVIADIDLDKQLEVVIGDSNGTVYCISTGWSSVKGQIDWPEFHNDHNRTGLFIPLVLDLVVDFDLYFHKLPSTDPLDPLTGHKWDEVLPGSENEYEITVRNKGNLNDSYDISLQAPMEGSGWDWFFNETGSLNTTVSLTSPLLVDIYGGNSSTILTVIVRCPSNASGHQQTPISVMATSDRSKEGQMMEVVTKEDLLIIVVAVQRQFRFWTDGPVRYTNSSGAAEFILNYSNTGNIRNSFLLRTSQVPSGWTVSYPHEPFYVDCGETISVRVTIIGNRYSIRDEKAGTTYDLYVSCSIEGTEPDSQVHLRVIVSQVFGFSAEVQEKDDIAVDPGSWRWTSINVRNHGNDDDVLKSYENTLPEGWSLEFHKDLFEPGKNDTFYEPEDFALNYKGSLVIYGLLRAPQSAKKGWYDIHFTIEGKGSSLEMGIDVFVGRLDHIRITGPNGEGNISIALPVGGMSEVLIGVSNIGKRWDLVRTSISGIDMDLFGKGWSIELLSIGRTRSSADRAVPVDISGPINISELDEGWEYVPADLPDNGTAGFGGISLSLGPNQTAWFRLLFKAPSKNILQRFHRTDLTLAAVGRSGSSSTSLNISISVLYPDITFLSDPVISGETASRFFAGDTITIESKLINTGDFPAKDMYVVLIVDGIRSDDAEAMLVRNGTDTYLVTFLFEAVEGSHEITVEIDPDNQIVESRDQFMDGGTNDNNFYETTIKVDEKKGHPNKNIWPLLLLAAVIMVAIMLVLYMIRSHASNRKLGEVKGRQEEE